MTPIFRHEHRWECPSCVDTAVSHEWPPAVHVHDCAGLKGLTIPFVPAGTRAVHRVLEREDYIGREDVRLDGDGRPVMVVNTIRDDGEDATVYAPCAHVTLDQIEEAKETLNA